MSFNVRMYTAFQKRKNSTKLPSGTYDEFPCVLKDTSSIISPTIEIAFEQNYTLANYTYAYIEGFGRYYFIKDIRYTKRVWEIDLEVDVLATYRAAILGGAKYVLRAESQYDLSITDKTRLMTNKVQTATRVTSCPWVNYTNLSSGAYVIGVIGDSPSGSTGCVNYYVMSAGEIRAFLAKAFDANVLDIDSDANIDAKIMKAFVNPTQYIVSIMWFPVDPPKTANLHVLHIGWWNTMNGYNMVSDQKVKRFNRVSIRGTNHPQATGTTHFLNASPYTTRSLFLPCFGEIPIDTDRGGSLEVAIDVKCDFLTGAAQADIWGSGNQSTETPALIARVNGQMGVSLPVAQMIQNGGGMLDAYTARRNAPLSFISGVGNMIGVGLSMLNPITVQSGVSLLGNGISIAGSSIIASDAAAMQGKGASCPTAYSSGALGSCLEVLAEKSDTTRQVCLSETFTRVTETSAHDMGLPLSQTKALSSLTGFCLCANGNVEIGGAKQEKDAIEAYLTSGFYIE